MAKLNPGVNDAATTDFERSLLMFADFEVAKSVTRSSARKTLFRCPRDARHPNWESRVYSVIVYGHGCSVCSGHRIVAGVNDAATTDPERSKMFADPEVAKTVSRGSGKKVWFQCPADPDGHPNWKAPVNRVIANGHGCPLCASTLCVTGINDVATTDPERSKMFVDQEVAKTVTRSSGRKAWFRCLEGLGHPEWESAVYNTIAGDYGCPSCATCGFDPSKPATLYVLDATTHIVYGITGNLDQRLKSYDDSRVLLHRFDFEDGGEARRLETAIKRQFKYCRYGESNLPGEMSESLTLGCLADLLAFVAQT